MTKSEENENKIISQRYAQSLLELIEEKEIEKEKIYIQLNDILESLNSSDIFQKTMNSPTIPNNEKKKVLDNLFKSNTEKIVLNFIKLLVDKNRFNIFSSIVKEFKNEINRQNGLLEINVTSAIELDKNEKAMIKVKLEKVLSKEIELNWATDNNIIGGLIFESGDNIIDCSLQHKLQDIKKEIII